MGHPLDKYVSKFSNDVIKGPAAAGEPSSKPQDRSGQWRLPSNVCCFIGCWKAVLMSPQCQSFSKFGSYSKYISLSSIFINRNLTVIFWYVVVYAFTPMCDKNLTCMIVKNSAIGIFPKIMVRALLIMMVRDDMIDHTPPFYSLWSSFNRTEPRPVVRPAEDRGQRGPWS